MQYNTFQEAFIGLNRKIIIGPEHITSSRIGDVFEQTGLSYTVTDLTSYKFEDESIGRLQYAYIETFYEWMISGSSDSQMLVNKYPSVSKFVEKPKSPDLPDNFNTFYGPRILSQLPIIEKELKQNPDTRRAVISILDVDDLNLLDKDENLEFPCTDSATFIIRENKLHCHIHMRSQNIGQVLKLDMYLWGRFTCELAKKLNIKPGRFKSSVVSAHIFKKDFSYLKTLIE